MDWKLRRGQIKHLLYEHCLNGRIDKEFLKEQFDDLNNVEPIKHGRWIGIDDFPHETWECDRCGKIIETDEPPHYCENCGAKMDEVEE